MSCRPVTIQSLLCAVTLLLTGLCSDIVGPWPIYVAGTLLQMLCSLACGRVHTGTELILFRGISGIAASFCQPTAMSIINGTVTPGKRRNMGLAIVGISQGFGFGVGAVLGGYFTGTFGWQWGFYVAAMVNFLALLLSIWQIPKQRRAPGAWSRITSIFDWVGCFLLTAAITLLLSVLS